MHSTSCYTLKNESGGWLGQVVLTEDGMFAAVTDWGNFSFAWRSYGDRTFKEFLLTISEDYFASKMFSGMSYIASNKKIEAACKRFAEKVLPALQKTLKEEAQAQKLKQENDRALPYS